MDHRELLAISLVCCLGLSLVAVQPALAGDDPGVSLFGDDSDELFEEDTTDGLIQEDTDEESDTREGANETDTADGETDGERADSDDGDRWDNLSDDESGDESPDSGEEMGDSERRNESETAADGGNESENDSESDTSDEWIDGSSDGDGDRADAGNETGNSTTSGNETSDERLLDDVSDIVVDVGNLTTYVTAGVAGNTTDDAVPTRGDVGDSTTDRDGDGDARMRPSVAGIEELVTALGSESVLVSNVVAAIADSPAEDDDRQLSTDAGFEGAAEKETGVEERTDVRDSSGPHAASDDAGDERSDEDGTAGADSSDDGGETPPGGPGEGAALLVLVGYLGGGRLAMNQTAMLASMGQPGLLGTLQQSIASHLGGLSDRLVPPVFGYSRHDSSDPLENETRARIYELVTESPGMYYAQLAEETDVTVETVRYHCRILADEGVVERRKLRGRQRLFPVSMDDDEPELAAAMADSAASDVLSAIERREPTTLSSVADAVDCAPSTVSYHLDRLEEDGLVSRERDGGSVRIRLRRATKSALQGSVADD